MRQILLQPTLSALHVIYNVAVRNWLILRQPVIPVLAVLTVISAATLAWYPFVHSDEVWLASLTRAMIEERSVAATEEFFVLTPRYPHAIKTLYHLIQMPFLAVIFRTLPRGSPLRWPVWRRCGSCTALSPH